MARVTIEDCLKQEGNRFALVHLTARRVRQLVKGAKPLVNRPENREIVTALREIAAGKVVRQEKVHDLDGASDVSRKEE